MQIEVERLRLEILFSQPLPPQLLQQQSPAQLPQQPCYVSRMTRDTGKMERGSQQTTVDDFLHTDCTRISKQGGDFSFQADVGVNPEITTSQDTARQEFSRLLMSRQHIGVIASSSEQNKQFDRGM